MIKFFPSVEPVCAERSKSMVVEVRRPPEVSEMLAWCVTENCNQNGKVVSVPPVEMPETEKLIK